MKKDDIKDDDTIEEDDFVEEEDDSVEEEDFEDESKYVPDFGFDDDDDNFEHAFDAVLKANES